MPTFGGGVNAKELAVFTRQFSVMIDAGLAAGAVPGDSRRAAGKQIFPEGTGRHAVHGGRRRDAVDRDAQLAKVFDGLYVNMVEAGETGGILDTILQRLSTYIEKNVKLQRAVKSALVYPVGVLTVAGLVITLLLWKVVPIFATLFEGLGVTLPLPTKIVIAMSNFIGSYEHMQPQPKEHATATKRIALVALARAYLVDPDILLLDEATPRSTWRPRRPSRAPPSSSPPGAPPWWSPPAHHGGRRRPDSRDRRRPGHRGRDPR